MSIIELPEAKKHLSRLVDPIETGELREIIIARDGRPVAKLTSPDAAHPASPLRPGCWKESSPQ